MASFWKPWTWLSGASHGDNFIRNVPVGWVEGAKRLGLPVNVDTAVQLAAVLCAVRVIAEGVAQQPLKVMVEEERDGKTYRRPAVDDPAYRLLHRRPNGWMTSFEWRETMTIHAVLTGNAYSVIGRVNGRLDELIPVHPDNMQVRLDNGVLRYRATIEGRQIDLLQEDVFHLRGPSMDGVLGMPIVRLARDVFGLASELEQQHLALQQKGGRPSGVLSTEQDLDPQAKEDLREEWNRKFGPNGDGGIAVLDKGWQFIQMMMSAVDQQFIENRRFQIEEIGRVFRVLPLMMMQADKAATFASAEQFFQAHDIHTLHPWTQRWEQTIDRDLLTDERTYANFVMQGLMRAAAADRAEYYARALGAPGARGWMTQNEVRGLEDLDPHPDGDELGVASPPSNDGGGPNAGLPFDPESDDEDKAYNPNQPRDALGRFLSVVGQIAQVDAARGQNRQALYMMGRVRRPAEVSRRAEQAIAALSGRRVSVDVSGYRHAMTSQGLQHSWKDHGPGSKEPVYRQVQRSDWDHIPSIVKSPDLIKPGINLGNGGEPRVLFRKKIGAVTYEYVAEVRKRKRRLDTVTFYRV